MGRRAGMVLITIALAMGGAHGQEPPEPGLLFYLSGDRGLTADYAAGGDPRPNFASDVRIIPDGARGAAIECGHTQLLSYRAAGQHLRRARHAVVLLALARAGRPHTVPDLPRRLRRSLQLGHGLVCASTTTARAASTRS